MNEKELFLLQGLSETEKEKIISCFPSATTFKRDEIIYSSDKFSKSLGIMRSGKAFAVTNNGHGVYMKEFENGACFGAAAVFGGDGNYVSTVIAKTDCEVLFISEDELKKLFLQYPVTAINYINFLSEKIRFLNKKLGMLTSSNAEDTVLNYLISVRNGDGYATLPKSMTLLSKMLGIGRATLYRCFDSLEESGHILRENNRVKVIKNEKNS